MSEKNKTPELAPTEIWNSLSDDQRKICMGLAVGGGLSMSPEVLIQMVALSNADYIEQSLQALQENGIVQITNNLEETRAKLASLPEPDRTLPVLEIPRQDFVYYDLERSVLDMERKIQADPDGDHSFLHPRFRLAHPYQDVAIAQIEDSPDF